MDVVGIVAANTHLDQGRRRAWAPWLLLLALALAPLWAFAEEDVDDDVMACLTARNLEPYSPAFFKAVPLCQRQVEPIRQARAKTMQARQAIWADCMIERIVALDNRNAAAAEVAAAAQDACETEYAAVVESMDLSADARARVHTKRHSITRELSVGMVLDVRAALDAERAEGKPPTY